MKVNYLKDVSSTPDMISSFNSHARTYLKFPLPEKERKKFIRLEEIVKTIPDD